MRLFLIQKQLLIEVLQMQGYKNKIMANDLGIQMVDLQSQYMAVKDQIDAGILDVLKNTSFIQGPQVSKFQEELEAYLDVAHVIPCANGTDALQIAMMALSLKPGDEVIVPCFTYIATAEVIALLGLKPVLVDVMPDTFMLDLDKVKLAITEKTKAIVPVHLFGQSCPMDELMELASEYNLNVIEDTAQALGAKYTSKKTGKTSAAGSIGHIGCTSFFPSKNLGCYGDGGALYTNDIELGKKIKMIANHGQSKKYHHQLVGVNSRLDSIQAAVLSVKLKHLNEYEIARQSAAAFYDQNLSELNWLTVPKRIKESTHVFHQYTLIVSDQIERDNFKQYLQECGIPSMVYYPIPLHLQPAFEQPGLTEGSFPITEKLCKKVISLPMHSEMTQDQLEYIVSSIKAFKF
jgi:UDP-2-acetamido-2-deoxy-ribo-hexuluronate aminotransferase